MNKLIWHEGLATGVTRIDALRKEFVEISNTIIQLIGQHSTSQKLSPLTDDIKLVLKNLIRYETDCIHRLNNKALIQLLERHIQSLRNFSIDTLDLALQGSELEKLALVEYLYRWYTEQLADVDLSYSESLKAAFNPPSTLNTTFTLRRFFEKHMSLSRGLFMLIIGMTLPALMLIYIIFNNSLTAINVNQDVTQLVELYKEITVVIHNLQKERGYSSAFLASDQLAFNKELIAQRHKTDSAIAATMAELIRKKNSSLLSRITQPIENALSTLQVLPHLREKVDNKASSYRESTKAYTLIIQTLISSSKELQRLEVPTLVANTISSLTSLIHLKESAGVERAAGAVGFGLLGFDEFLVREMLISRALQGGMRNIFYSYGTKKQINQFNLIIHSKNEQLIDSMRHQALLAKDQQTITVSAINWWDSTTKTMDKLESFIQEELFYLLATTYQKKRTAYFQASFVGIGCLILLVFVINTLFWLITCFQNPVISVAKATRGLAQGNYALTLNYTHRKDEVGELIEAYETLRQQLLRAHLSYHIYTETKINTHKHALELKREVAIGQSYKRDALTDPLTGLANRRSILAYANEVLEKSQQRKLRPSIILLDIDNFKSINDNYGHDVGDEVIKLTATESSRDLRVDDSMARIGGEEFAAFLPFTSLDEAQLIAERMRANISKKELTLDSQQAIKFTVSIGVAYADEKTTDFNQLFKHADLALYQAKTSGKNCVKIYCGNGSAVD